MIDDDDVENFAIFANTGNGPVGCALFVIILVILIVVSSMNKEECSKRSCPAGTEPKVMSHECLCVTRPGGNQ